MTPAQTAPTRRWDTAEYLAWRDAGMPQWATPIGAALACAGYTPDQVAPYWIAPPGRRLIEARYIGDYLAHGIPAATVYDLQHAGVLRGEDILALCVRGCPTAFAHWWLGAHLTENNATRLGATFALRFVEVTDALGCPPAWLEAFWRRFVSADPHLHGPGLDHLRAWYTAQPHLDPEHAALLAAAGVTVTEYAAQPDKYGPESADSLGVLVALRQPLTAAR